MHTRPDPVLHRDLKPDNVLVARRGDEDLVKVADFRLAKAVDGVMGMGGAAGTLAYMGPEGFEYGTCIPASDVYSIGLIGYEMLFGGQPFARVGRGDGGDDYDAVRAEHVAARKAGVAVRPGDALDLSSHPKVADVLRAALAYDVEKRYRNAQRLYEDLARVAADDAPTGPAGETPDETLARLRRELDCFLRRDDYAEAARVAADAARRFPGRQEGWLAEARVKEAQADAVRNLNNTALQTKLLKQAAKVLIDAQGKVPAGSRGDLLREIGRLFQKLGDPRAGEPYLRQAGDEERKGGRT